MKKQKIDTYNYKGWLTSDNILKRSFAVLGHYYLAYLFISISLLFIVLVLFLIGLMLGIVFQPLFGNF